MKLTPAQAAKAVGMTKAGIIRAIHNGKLSATRNSHGHFEIDPAELFRVYEPVSTGGKSGEEVADHETDHQAESLREKVAMLERIIRDKDDVIDDLRTRLDAESDERRKANMVITTLTQKEAEKPKGFWARLLGGSG